VKALVRVKNDVDTTKYPAIAKLDAHNVANRILRKENYMISIFNKSILNLTIPIFGKRRLLTNIVHLLTLLIHIDGMESLVLHCRLCVWYSFHS
jgi:hypothetical protein